MDKYLVEIDRFIEEIEDEIDETLAECYDVKSNIVFINDHDELKRITQESLLKSKKIYHLLQKLDKYVNKYISLDRSNEKSIEKLVNSKTCLYKQFQDIIDIQYDIKYLYSKMKKGNNHAAYKR